MTNCRACAHFKDTSGTRCGPCVALPNKPNFAARWTQEQVDALGADKGFLPERYWPENYVHKQPS